MFNAMSRNAVPARRSARSRLQLIWIAVLAVAGLLAFWPGGASASPLSGAATPVFNVKNYGATGNGSTNDAAGDQQGDRGGQLGRRWHREFPSGTYKVGASVHMMSNVTLHLDSGSTLTGHQLRLRRARVQPERQVPGLRAQPLP